MIALPDVSQLVRPAAETVLLDLALPEDQPAFDGHFPGQPVLPGVVQLDWALRFASVYLDLVQPVARDFQVKFRRTIGPARKVSLLLTLNRAKGHLAFQYRLDGEAASLGKIRLEDAA